MICGTYGMHKQHLSIINTVLGRQEHVNNFYAMNLLVLPGRTLFLCDTYVNYEPTAEQIFEMTCLAAEEVRRFGMIPKVALLSHSSFGTDESVTAAKMRAAFQLLQAHRPDIEVEGEMHGDAALNSNIRLQIFPNARMREDANLLVFPTLDAANIAFNLLKTASGDGMTVGPILLGAAKPAHILTPTATVRRIVNMTALTVVEAGRESDQR
jgi:malate dehydrogenase (oxaloacetate-decarboxylating)(NADP+)